MTTIPGTRVEVTAQRTFPRGSALARTARLGIIVERAEALVDLTGSVRELVAGSGVDEGTVQLYCGHTTCGLLINESDPGLETDLGRALERLLPHSGHHPYAHDKHRTPAERLLHGERDNGHAHLRTQLTTHPELNIPVTEGALHLGRWQAVLLAEYDGPRTRELLVRIIDLGR
ncbi:secondary thiamine-phosphate synthase enzyme YjbQ [Streptomyces sp. NPDC052396]|uniref:secondary thiamine-phosphate synthase enzyme YjbQ n=1 Tax=Streptomyces sp. NPDC052396 TaxID=3365689 RepID=UPI0037D2B2B8